MVNYLSLIGCPLKGAWVGYESNMLISVLSLNLAKDKYSYSEKKLVVSSYLMSMFVPVLGYVSFD